MEFEILCARCGSNDYVICYAKVFQHFPPLLCLMCNDCGSVTYSVLVEALLTKEVKK